MSDAQVAELYERLTKGRAIRPPVDKPFLRGWNAGIDFAIKEMRLACDEPVEETETTE
jgi:hypothetical protein